MVNARQELPVGLARSDLPPVEWAISEGLVPFPDALAAQEARVEAIADGRAAECVWLLEHPPLYTAGTSAREHDLLDRHRFPVFHAGRGGEFTYHGPGQRIAYVMLNLRERGPDVRRFVATLEAWVIAALAEMQVRGERREDRVGVWVRRPEKPPLPNGAGAEDKIAALGIRVRRWVTFHGLAVNVDPDLEHFSGIVPCGVHGYGVTSLADLGLPVSMPEFDGMLRRTFEPLFGPTVRAEAPVIPSPAP